MSDMVCRRSLSRVRLADFILLSITLGLASPAFAQQRVVIGYSKDARGVGEEINDSISAVLSQWVSVVATESPYDATRDDENASSVRRKYRAIAASVEKKGKRSYYAIPGTGYPLGTQLSSVKLLARNDEDLAALATLVALENVQSGVPAKSTNLKYASNLCEAIRYLIGSGIKFPTEIKGSRCFAAK